MWGKSPIISNQSQPQMDIPYPYRFELSLPATNRGRIINHDLNKFIGYWPTYFDHKELKLHSAFIFNNDWGTHVHEQRQSVKEYEYPMIPTRRISKQEYKTNLL